MPLDGDQVAKCVIEQFDKCLKGKPVIRSNGAKEWTVVAGVVAFFEDDQLYRVLCVTSGVKALPDHLIAKSNGRVLHDCHAEILALRAFNRVVVDECMKGESEILQHCADDEEYQWKLKPGVKFSLYISEPPCGDASLELLADESEEQWSKVTQLDGGVLRGRDCFGDVGKVRTKPGRRDSPLTLSKSCSDKLCLKEFTGILNSLVSQFVKREGFYLDSIVLPNGKSVDAGFERCFHSRLEGETEFQPIRLLTTTEHHDWEKETLGQSPSALSLICIPGSLEESINNFVKEGFYAKKQLVRLRGESCVSRREVFAQCRELLTIDDCLTYQDVKRTNFRYQELKQLGKDALRSWNQTHRDNFTI